MFRVYHLYEKIHHKGLRIRQSSQFALFKEEARVRISASLLICSKMSDRRKDFQFRVVGTKNKPQGLDSDQNQTIYQTLAFD
jgi:hypothetical protein